MPNQIEPYGDRGAFEFLEYDPRLPGAFELVVSLISHEDRNLTVEHVGSTAVPGCPGKGYIDILVCVPGEGQVTAAQEAVLRAGFEEHDFGQGYLGARGSIHFSGTRFRIHIQILVRDSAKALEMIAFRELLKSDPELVAGYAALKQRLIGAGINRNPEYTSGKSDLIRATLQRRLPR